MSGDNLPIGDTWDFDVTVTDNGAVVDISGATLTAKGQADVNSSPLFSVSTVLGTNSNTQAGKGRVSVPASTTAALSEGDAEISIKISIPGSPVRVYTLYKDTHTIEKI